LGRIGEYRAILNWLGTRLMVGMGTSAKMEHDDECELVAGLGMEREMGSFNELLRREVVAARARVE